MTAAATDLGTRDAQMIRGGVDEGPVPATAAASSPRAGTRDETNTRARVVRPSLELFTMTPGATAKLFPAPWTSVFPPVVTVSSPSMTVKKRLDCSEPAAEKAPGSYSTTAWAR